MNIAVVCLRLHKNGKPIARWQCLARLRKKSNIGDVMSKKKRYRGHYCKVCDSIMANEKFSGKGHATHVCKKCAKLPLEKRNEKTNLNRIYSLCRFSNLSKQNRAMLQKYLTADSPVIKAAAVEVFMEFSNTQKNMELHEDNFEYDGMEASAVINADDDFYDSDDIPADLEDLF